MFLLILLSFFLFRPGHILANDRQIFGLHLTQTTDISQAHYLINSSGGDWGWVTIVIRTDQLNHQSWQEFFDNCRRFHLVPIVRLATILDQDNWKRPSISDIDNLASFLNSLNWPSFPQHIITFNEINHASEWGGEVDLKNYADLAVYTAQKFKNLNPNFFIIPAALDLASPSLPPKFESAPNSYQQILQYKPSFFDYFDGLASHSYPNHGYIGSPYDTGQHSILGYSWELNYLKNLGVNKILPTYITETGWPHLQGQDNNHQYYSIKTAVSFLQIALTKWQSDPIVQAVTPFIFNYPNPPFDHFSWLDKTETLYSEYQSIINLPKSKNSPDQITSHHTLQTHLPLLIFSDTEYTGTITLKNTGQSIWGETKFCLTPQASPNIKLEMICTDNTLIPPGQSHTFTFKFTVSSPKNKKDDSFISWQNIDPVNISPINSSGTIYHPNFSFLQSLRSLLLPLISF